jgi:hypothetical protein
MFFHKIRHRILKVDIFYFSDREIDDFFSAVEEFNSNHRWLYFSVHQEFWWKVFIENPATHMRYLLFC